MTMVNQVEQIESLLAHKFNKTHCVLTGSGTTAIYCLIKSLDLKPGDTVLLPGVCCFAPAYAVKYAGLKLDFCDVSLVDGCVTAELIDQAIQSNTDIKVVIGVHSFGNVLDVDAIQKVCTKHNVIFVEDACQSYGSEYQGKLCGSFGDFSVLSFGHTKILDAGGNGAVLTNDDQWAAFIRQEVAILGKQDSNRVAKLFEQHRQEYYAVQNNEQFEGLGAHYKDAFICGMNEQALQRLEELLKKESEMIQHRKQLGAIYEQELKLEESLQIICSQYNAVPWRFTCLLRKDNIRTICDGLRKAGFDMSHWYPNLANMFIKDNQRTLENSNLFEQNVINMWLDESKDQEYVVKLCSFLKNLIRQYSS